MKYYIYILHIYFKYILKQYIITFIKIYNTNFLNRSLNLAVTKKSLHYKERLEKKVWCKTGTRYPITFVHDQLK